MFELLTVSGQGCVVEISDVRKSASITSIRGVEVSSGRFPGPGVGYFAFDFECLNCANTACTRCSIIVNTVKPVPQLARSIMRKDIEGKGENRETTVYVHKYVYSFR
jgi:hypothetical protein